MALRPHWFLFSEIFQIQNNKSFKESPLPQSKKLQIYLYKRIIKEFIRGILSYTLLQKMKLYNRLPPIYEQNILTPPNFISLWTIYLNAI